MGNILIRKNQEKKMQTKKQSINTSNIGIINFFIYGDKI